MNQNRVQEPRFFVELPCLPEDTANKPVCKKYEALTTAEIMVVEDEETNYYLIESILRKYKTRLIHLQMENGIKIY